MKLPTIAVVATVGLAFFAAAASAETPTNKLQSNNAGTATMTGTFKPPATALTSTTQFATGTASTVPQATKGNLQR